MLEATSNQMIHKLINLFEVVGNNNNNNNGSRKGALLVLEV